MHISKINALLKITSDIVFYNILYMVLILANIE